MFPSIQDFIKLSSSVWFKAENKVNWKNFLKITVQLNGFHRSLFFLVINYKSTVKNAMLSRICLVVIKYLKHVLTLKTVAIKKHQNIYDISNDSCRAQRKYCTT